MRISALFAAVASAFAIGVAQADVIIIDDFNLPTPTGVQIWDTSFDRSAGPGTDDGLGASSGTMSLASNPSLLATTRVISHVISQSITDAVVVNTGLSSSVGVGASPNSPAGSLSINNGNDIASNVGVQWALKPLAVASGSPVSIFFDVITSNVGVPGANNTFDFTIGIGSFQRTIGNVAATTTLSFLLTASEVAALIPGGTMTMQVNGDPGFDISLNAVGLIIPEPTSLALVGLALVGAGLAARRRKA